MQRLFTLASVLTALVFATPASAYTHQEQNACQGDAFQFCGDAIPDEGRVKACLIKNARRLSPACKQVFSSGRRIRRR